MNTNLPSNKENIQNMFLDKKSESEIRKVETIEDTKQALSEELGLFSGVSKNGKTFSNVDLIKEANRLIKEYGLSQLGNKIDYEYLSRVISIQDFQDNPDKYFLKLTKGFGSFPLDFDVNTVLEELFGSHLGIGGIEDGVLNFQQKVVFGDTILADSVSKALKDLGINKANTEGYIKIDYLSFLKNYDSLYEIFKNEFLDYESNSFDQFLHTLQTLKYFSLSLFNTVTNIKIQEPNIFFKNKMISPQEAFEKQKQTVKSIDECNPYKPSNEKEQKAFFNFEKLFLETAKGLSQESIDKLLSVQNSEEFYTLLDYVIGNIDKNPKLKNIGKNIENANTEELITFATYIARYLIESYADLDNQVDMSIKGYSKDQITGKCSDYTGMALQIINRYFKVLYPEKFENLYIGFDEQHIGNYNHVYIKIYGFDENGQIISTFIDPTKLSKSSIKKLKYTKNILKNMDSSNLPIQIDRTAEDIIITKLKKDNKKIKDNNLLKNNKSGLLTDKSRKSFNLIVDLFKKLLK